LEWARQGKDGPLLPTACFVARAGEQDASNGEAAIVGAAIITLLPAGRLRYASRTSGYVPHLNWIFVPWMEQRRGVATMLLGSIVRELRALGHSMLASTVITGNAPAVLWHWSCGFRLQRVG
jgi:GNAT superfamily N-acetyltransferase